VKRTAVSTKSAIRRGGRRAKHAAQPATAAPPDRSQQRDAPDAVAQGAFVAADSGIAGDGIGFGSLSLHDLFEQQARTMLERADIDEEQKQGILVAVSCPCCGVGGLSFSVKLKR
jgi:hypothetical protein